MPFPQRIVPYVPWKYIYPRQWTVGVLSDPFGLGQTLQIQTTASDPASIHFFALDLLFPTGGSPSGSVSYTNQRLWPAFNASLAQTDLVTNGLIVDNHNLDYLQRTIFLSTSIDLPVLRTADTSGDLGFGYDYSAYGPISAIPVGDPTGAITVFPRSALTPI